MRTRFANCCIVCLIIWAIKMNLDDIKLSNIEPITSFNGPNRFLSNFYQSVIIVKQNTIFIEHRYISFATVEHAYQAAKTDNLLEKFKISQCSTPGEAKRLGQKLELIDNWDNLKVDIMHDLLRAKFTIPELRQKLLDTGNRVLIEGNNWGDKFWGVCEGEGENMLGELLMQVRNEIK